MSHADGVGMETKHNRDRFGGPSGRLDLGRRGRNDDVNVAPNKLGGKLRQLI